MSSPWIKNLMNRSIWKESERERPLSRSTTKQIVRKNGTITIYMGASLLETEISDLQLSVRSYNCLRRAGLNTVGDIVNVIESEEDLLKYRNLGRQSATEIISCIDSCQKTLMHSESNRSSEPAPTRHRKPLVSSFVFIMNDKAMDDERILW